MSYFILEDSHSVDRAAVLEQLCDLFLIRREMNILDEYAPGIPLFLSGLLLRGGIFDLLLLLFVG